MVIGSCLANTVKVIPHEDSGDRFSLQTLKDLNRLSGYIQRNKNGDFLSSKEILELFESHFLDRIARMLSDDSLHQQRHRILDFLFLFSRDYDDEVRLYQVDGLVKELIGLLLHHTTKHNIELQIDCAGILNHLAHKPANALRLYNDSEIIDIILKFLKTPLEVQTLPMNELRETLLYLLCKIVACSQTGPNIPCILGQNDQLMSAVFHMLQSTYSPVQLAAVSVFAVLTSDNENQVRLYKREGLVARVLELLEKSLIGDHHDLSSSTEYDEEYWTIISLNLQEYLLALLINFSDPPINQRLMFENPNLLSLLNRFLQTTSEDIQTNASAVLWNLSNEISNQAMFLHVDGNLSLTKRLIELSRSESSSQIVRRNVAKTLWNMCENEENASHLLNGGDEITKSHLLDVLYGDVEWHYMKFKVPFQLIELNIHPLPRELPVISSISVDISSHTLLTSPIRQSAIRSLCDCEDLRREFILSYL